jgi:hypothetical protein
MAMLGDRRGLFRVGPGARGIVLATLLSFSLLGIGAPPSAAQGSSGGSVVPADGRLNLPDFMAKVTSVSWPARNDGREPTPGRRFVRFTLEVTSIGQPESPVGSLPTLNAALRWDGASHPLPLSSIDDELGHVFSSAQSATASASYMADVPTDTHDVELTLSEGTFSQSFDLWTLRRTPPAPAVLYRDPAQTSVTASAPGPTTLSLANPSDGFASSATVTLQSATLGYFAPSGTLLAPDPDQAVLSVVLRGDHPDEPNNVTGSGHYLGSEAPLSAAMVSFTPAGAAAAPATLSNAGSTEGQGNADDGLFDATYSFVVPAALTSGTLHIASGPFTGAEFTLYTAESGTTTLDVTAPATLSLSFPAPVAEAVQRKTPWVGQPDPPTASTSAASAASNASSSSGHDGALSLWWSLVGLVLVAAVVIVFQRRHSRTATATASPAVPLAGTADFGRPPDPDSARPLLLSEQDVADDIEVDDAALADGELGVDFLGPLRFVGVDLNPRTTLGDLYTYLSCHDRHLQSAEQIGVGMRPNADATSEASRKTIHNNLSLLRQHIGPEHLPDAASAGGYRLVGVRTDRDRFEDLVRQAESLDGAAARDTRSAALALVRGQPFAGVPSELFEWVGEERLVSTITVAIAACAHRLAMDCLEGGDPLSAEAAVEAGLRGAPRESKLWEAGARAIDQRGDPTALRRWLADAEYRLGSAEAARISAVLGTHLEPSE